MITRFTMRPRASSWWGHGRCGNWIERVGFFVITYKIPFFLQFLCVLKKFLYQNGIELNFQFKGIISLTCYHDGRIRRGWIICFKLTNSLTLSIIVLENNYLHQNGVEFNFLCKGIICVTIRPWDHELALVGGWGRG